MHVEPLRYQEQRCLHYITFSCYRQMQRGWKGWSRSNRNGLRGGEKRVSCSWGEPILPPRTREGWGNLVSRLDYFALWRAKINPRWWMTLLWGLTEAAIIAPTDAPDLWHETRSLRNSMSAGRRRHG